MNRLDNDFASTASFRGDAATGYARLDISTTAASYASLPVGTYVVRLTGGPTLVSIRHGGTAADPASGAAETGAACADGDTYEHPSTANASVIVLGGSGSGRAYFVAIRP